MEGNGQSQYAHILKNKARDTDETFPLVQVEFRMIRHVRLQYPRINGIIDQDKIAPDAGQFNQGFAYWLCIIKPRPCLWISFLLVNFRISHSR